jgi:hypothetical protein
MRKKKRIIATGTVVTTLLLAGASVTFAQSAAVSSSNRSSVRPPHMRPMIDEIAVDLGLDVTTIQEELREGKTPKEVLLELGVSQDKVQKLFREKDYSKKVVRPNMSVDMLNTLANALGISLTELKQHLANGEKPESIAIQEGLTKEQFHQNLIVELRTLLNNGGLSASDTAYYKRMVERLQQSTL